MATATEQFSTPDDFGELRASDLAHYDRLRVITDAQHFIVPAIWLLAAIVFLFAVRLLIRSGGGRLGRLIKLWFDAKEQELRRRAGHSE